jgi:RNA polymerase sigma factor (sigma-70 family)
VSPWLADLTLSAQSDERLVALARGGHERAFATIVERYRRELVGHARRLDSGGRAEDIVQQTFLSAFAALQSGAEVVHLRGWLHQILRHTAIRAHSRERPASELDAALGATESLEDAVESRMLAADLLSELGRLPTRQRRAIVEMSIGGLSRAEVASSMGLSEGAVRQLVHRARATLRTAVTALTPYPFAKLLGGAVHGAAKADGASEIAVGAGTASAGAVAVKLGALVASAAVATTVVALPSVNHHPRAAHVRSAVTTRAGHRSAATPLLSAATASAHSGAVSSTHGAAAVSGGRSGRAAASSGGGGSPGGPGQAGTGRNGSPDGSGSSGASSSQGGSSNGDGGGGRQSSGGSGSGDGGGSQAPTTNGGDSGSGGGSSTSGSGNGGASGGGDGSTSGGGSSSDGGSPVATVVTTSGSGSDGGTGSSSGSGGGSNDGSGSASSSGSGSGSVTTDGGSSASTGATPDGGSSGLSGD